RFLPAIISKSADFLSIDFFRKRDEEGKNILEFAFNIIYKLRDKSFLARLLLGLSVSSVHPTLIND
ncbi:MAG: hypothetical protein WCF82_13115, partial [Microcoleus sp.]